MLLSVEILDDQEEIGGERRGDEGWGGEGGDEGWGGEVNGIKFER